MPSGEGHPLSLGKSEEARGDNGGNGVEHEKREQYPRVPPPVLVLHIKRQEKLVAPSILAILARVGRVLVLQVTSCSRHEGTRPFFAGLSLWRREYVELAFFTLDPQFTMKTFR